MHTVHAAVAGDRRYEFSLVNCFLSIMIVLVDFTYLYVFVCIYYIYISVCVDIYNILLCV
ncbi:hypothetical protein HanRHA438_Chr11g0519321 [Helianthus annuus]|nr:hypothetical protein HanRHA438_Chr11g0519321 [Helianthus annuus]